MSHPITPPPELVQQWINEEPGVFAEHIATRAAQWGADQELEACCAFAQNHSWGLVNGPHVADVIRAARRPKPPSLKEQALETLKYPKDLWSENEVDTIRRALETLPE